MISKKGEYREELRPVADGKGNILFRHRFEREDMHGFYRLCAELTVLPGDSLGKHPHIDDAEIYYMLEGELVSINGDGSEEPFLPGDVMMTGGGAVHSLRNDSSSSATFLAIVAIKHT